MTLYAINLNEYNIGLVWTSSKRNTLKKNNTKEKRFKKDIFPHFWKKLSLTVLFQTENERAGNKHIIYLKIDNPKTLMYNFEILTLSKENEAE